MRIITGKRKGLKLNAPKGKEIRPTEDRIKESLFNILGDVSDSYVLDLFSGSGSIGLEFLSRGAKYVVFVDNKKNSINCIKKNLEKANLPGSKIIHSNYKNAINILENKNIRFDFLYIDPPYNSKDIYEDVLNFVHKSSIFEKSLIIIETRDDINLNSIKLFNIVDRRKYRKTILYFLRRNDI